jgi:hypothetical protein
MKLKIQPGTRAQVVLLIRFRYQVTFSCSWEGLSVTTAAGLEFIAGKGSLQKTRDHLGVVVVALAAETGEKYNIPAYAISLVSTEGLIRTVVNPTPATGGTDDVWLISN